MILALKCRGYSRVSNRERKILLLLSERVVHVVLAGMEEKYRLRVILAFFRPQVRLEGGWCSYQSVDLCAPVVDLEIWTWT